MGIRLACSARAWRHRWEDPIVWTGSSPPHGEARQAVHDAIVHHHQSTFGAVAEYVAAELFRQDLERVGAEADIGYFRPLFLIMACRAIDSLVGTHVVTAPSRLAARLH